VHTLHKPGTRVSFYGLNATTTLVGDELIAVVFDSKQHEPTFINLDEAERMLGKELLFLTSKVKEESIDVDLSPKQLIELNKVQAYLEGLWQVVPKGKTGGIPKRKAAIDYVSELIGDSNPPDPSTLARWVKETTSHHQGVLALVKKRERRAGSKFGEEVKDLFDSVIRHEYLNLRRPTRTYAYSQFVNRLEEELGLTEVHEIPSYGTFCNWIKQLNPIEVAEKRFGKLAAKSLNRNAHQEIQLHRIFERVEVDALRLGVGVVDDQGRYLGTIIVFFVLDCYSRSVLGFQIQVGGGESAASVIDSYKHAMAPKYPEEVDPTIKCTWPMYGALKNVVSDGGSGYKAIETHTFLLHLNAGTSIAATYSGEKKPFIESFNKTVRAKLAPRLAGYVPKIAGNQPSDATIEQQAVLTLDQVKRKLTKWIVDDYHQTEHEGLNWQTPHQVWTENAKLFPPAIPDELFTRLKLTHGESKTPKILGDEGHLGITVNNARYNDPDKRLKSIYGWLKQRGKEPRVECEFTPNDIHSVSVKDPESHERFPVFATDRRIQPGMTLREWDVIRLENKPPSRSRRSALDGDPELLAADKQSRKQIKEATKRKSTSANLPEMTKGVHSLRDSNRASKSGSGSKPDAGTLLEGLSDENSNDEGYDVV